MVAHEPRETDTMPTRPDRCKFVRLGRFATPALAASLVAFSLAGCGDGSNGAGAEGGGAAVSQSGEQLSGQAEQGNAGGQGQIARAFTFGDVSFTVPEPWTPVTPSSAMRAAQFLVEPPEGAEDPSPGIGAVFTSIGGGIDENLERWEAQFIDPADRDISRAVATINGRTFATLVGRGTFDEGRAMGSTGPKQDYMMLAFIVETNTDRPVFMKLTGPATTLEPHLDGAWQEMVDSVTIAE
jgi:hypothetical protein